MYQPYLIFLPINMALNRLFLHTAYVYTLKMYIFFKPEFVIVRDIKLTVGISPVWIW